MKVECGFNLVLDNGSLAVTSGKRTVRTRTAAAVLSFLIEEKL